MNTKIILFSFSFVFIFLLIFFISLFLYHGKTTIMQTLKFFDALEFDVQSTVISAKKILDTLRKIDAKRFIKSIENIKWSSKMHLL